MKSIKKIGVFTSGGDSPGMNAAIRAVVRTGLYYNLEVVGIMRGYEGLINGEIIPMDRKSVANIVQRGGTILKTARSDDFRTTEGRKKAFENVQKHGIDALVGIGGDGTFTGASIFIEEFDVPIMGLPGTIDNDLIGTDFTIGYDTAINTVVDAVDKIRDTAESHDRLFIVEVMGRDSGLIALRSGIGTGAEAILIPETKTDIEAILQNIDRDNRRKKTVRIIVVAEGDEFGGSSALLHTIQNRFPELDVRATVLGHIQRGGAPSCADRVLSSRLGYAAIEALLKGTSQVMVGIINDEIVFTPFAQAVKENSKINDDMLQMIKVLSA